MTYYSGDLDKDLAEISEDPNTPKLRRIVETTGYGRAQQLVRVLRDNQDDVQDTLPLYELRALPDLRDVVSVSGYTRPQWIIQILWAERLRADGRPITGALDPR